jgi:hypothetical protein
LNLNNGSLILVPVESLFCFSHFIWRQHQVHEQVWGEISQVYRRHTHLRSPTLALHNINCTKLEWSVCPMGQLNHHFSSLFLIFFKRNSMCTLYLTLFDSWVWMSFNLIC